MIEKQEQDLPHSNVDLNALGQAIDTTWGRSSTPNTAAYSVKMTLGPGPTLNTSYAAVVNFGTEHEMIAMKRRYEEESVRVTNEVLKNVKQVYKQLTGKTLKLKELGASTGLEMLTAAIFNPKRTAYFRRHSKHTVA